MANKYTLTGLFKAIADMIREKEGSTDLIPVTEFPERITAAWENLFVDIIVGEITSIDSSYLDGLEVIRGGAFAYCTKLKTITLPDTIREINSNVFLNCTSLESIIFNTDTIYSIMDYAFGNCTSLEYITLPNSVGSIYSNAFTNCTKLKSITIPGDTNMYGDYIFSNCTSLESVTFNGMPGYINGDNIFEGCTNLKTINVPWAEGEVSGIPWGAVNATINYNYGGE